jgi:hypothetical protein
MKFVFSMEANDFRNVGNAWYSYMVPLPTNWTYFARFEVSNLDEDLSRTVFRVVTPCSDVAGHQRFGETYSFHLQCEVSGRGHRCRKEYGG